MGLKKGYAYGPNGKPMPALLAKESKREEQIRVLELQIRINEMIPADMRSHGFISKMKAKLARLKGEKR